MARRLLSVLRPGRPGDTERGSIAMAMMLTLVGTTLSALLVPMVITQISAARTAVQRLDALNAAQAGLDMALGHIRAAAEAQGTELKGLLNQLPCTDLLGNVNDHAELGYRVSVSYYDSDPRGKAPNVLDPLKIPCVAGVKRTPSFALLSSTGSITPGGSSASTPLTRTLTATYTFKKTNQNIPGGLIHVYKTSTSTDLCMDAGSATPAAGTPLQMRPCTPGALQQKFAYNQNLTVQLVPSLTPSTPLGMCLDAGTPHRNDALVLFQPCAATVKPQQQWSINDSANFEGTSNGSTLNGYCFVVQNPNVSGSYVIIRNGSNCRKAYDNQQTWSPDPAVGAGAAGAATLQLVNFKQFGRCADVTEGNVNFGYLIAWPCKQAPNVANVLWNQKWTMPLLPSPDSAYATTGVITTTRSPVTYCLQSPRSTGKGKYVTIQTCAGNDNQKWTVYKRSESYTESYRIQDADRNCLSLTDSKDLYPKGQQISKLIVAKCDDSLVQKWNADPSILNALPLKDIGEK